MSLCTYFCKNHTNLKFIALAYSGSNYCSICLDQAKESSVCKTISGVCSKEGVRAPVCVCVCERACVCVFVRSYVNNWMNVICIVIKML